MQLLRQTKNNEAPQMIEFRARVKQAILNMKYFGWDGSIFYQKDKPVLKKGEGGEEKAATLAFMKERDKLQAEQNLIHNLLSLYVSYITCPIDEEPEMIIENAYEEFRLAIKENKKQAARQMKTIVILDAHGFEQSVPVEEKLRVYDQYKTNFMRMCEMIDDALSKIKINRSAGL